MPGSGHSLVLEILVGEEGGSIETHLYLLQSTHHHHHPQTHKGFPWQSLLIWRIPGHTYPTGHLCSLPRSEVHISCDSVWETHNGLAQWPMGKGEAIRELHRHPPEPEQPVLQSVAERSLQHVWRHLTWSHIARELNWTELWPHNFCFLLEF